MVLVGAAQRGGTLCVSKAQLRGLDVRMAMQEHKHDVKVQGTKAVQAQTYPAVLVKEAQCTQHQPQDVHKGGATETPGPSVGLHLGSAVSLQTGMMCINKDDKPLL